MFLIAFLLSFVPAAMEPAVHPLCGGLSIPDGIVIDESGHATVHVSGCATHVLVTCDAPFRATLPRRFLVDGDSFTVEGAVPYTGREVCRVSSAQGRLSVMIEEP